MLFGSLFLQVPSSSFSAAFVDEDTASRKKIPVECMEIGNQNANSDERATNQADERKKKINSLFQKFSFHFSKWVS